MSKSYEPKYHLIEEIYLKEIIFEKRQDSTDVTIFGYYEKPFEERLKRVDYCCEFSMLTDLLLFAKEEGEPIISAITDKLTDNDTEIPTIIDVENILGRLLKIENIVLTIYRPMQEDENGEWKEDVSEEFYFIDSVVPKEKFEQPKASNDSLRNALAEHFILLENAYKYYLQLLSFEFSEKVSRKKAGLEDELLFRMAIINHQIIKSNE
ncbi:MAG TPA: hypothetical protein PLQ78_10790 [Flavipsychrobacter sp.]|nr:hypothetical protein [Flavipsychrobacter sp.]